MLPEGFPGFFGAFSVAGNTATTMFESASFVTAAPLTTKAFSLMLAVV